jgi:hypothetical protein
MIEINKNPSLRTLRQFSLALGVFAAIGYFVIAPGGSSRPTSVIWTTCAVIAISGLVRPASIYTIYLAMSYLTAPIGIVVSLTVLGIVYYIVVTPIGLVMRLFGMDPLQRRGDPKADTYWRKREQPQPDQYFRQF